MADPNIILCAPLAEVGGLRFDPKTAPYSEYTQVECPHCRQGMWLGQRSRVMVESGQAQMMCMVCAVRSGVLPPGAELQPLTDRDP